jgi:serine/threonine protein kinase
MLEALKFMKKESIIHCDMKPENILLHDKENKLDGGKISIIDLGSSCFENE